MAAACISIIFTAKGGLGARQKGFCRLGQQLIKHCKACLFFLSCDDKMAVNVV